MFAHDLRKVSLSSYHPTTTRSHSAPPDVTSSSTAFKYIRVRFDHHLHDIKRVKSVSRGVSRSSPVSDPFPVASNMRLKRSPVRPLPDIRGCAYLLFIYCPSAVPSAPRGPITAIERYPLVSALHAVNTFALATVISARDARGNNEGGRFEGQLCDGRLEGQKMVRGKVAGGRAVQA